MKMMTLNSIDKQFIDDNMLTDEDFLCDIEPIEQEQSSRNISSEMLHCSQLESSAPEQNLLSNGLTNSSQEESFDILNEFFQSPVVDKRGKLLNSSMASHSSSTSNAYSSIPVITSVYFSMPKDNQNYDIYSHGADTPPHTPSGSSDSSLESPVSQPQPVILTMPAPQIAYVVPPSSSQLPVIPTKPHIILKPKIIQTKSAHSSSNGKSVENGTADEPLVKLPSVFLHVQSSTSSETTSSKNSSDSHENNKKRKEPSDPESQEINEKALKRQTRIMKNRESASLSRKKKKEYVEKLEADLHQITAENSSLRVENNQLKLRITNLENELTVLKAAFSSKAMKKTCCFMVVLFIMTVNLGPLNNIFDKVPDRFQKSDFEDHRKGRILLWNEENKSREFNATDNYINDKLMEAIESSYIMSWKKSYNTSCLQFINKSESMRLEKDLLGWVKRVEKKQKQKDPREKNKFFNLKSTIPPLPKLQLRSKLANENRKDIWAKKKNRNEILIYQTPRKDYKDFFDAIHRRDDSFYFVSFSGDHLLLPAIAHNQTLRPRMSFVMPAMTLNDSIDSDNYISMMQIDCEVIDTKLIYIKESVIPPHLRQKQNSTSKSNSRNKARVSTNKHSKLLQDANVNFAF